MPTNISFKKGKLAGLNGVSKVAGQLLLTTDERALYFDVSESERIRLGDFQEFATLAALQANPNPSTTALYYVSDINCLAKYNGTAYVQINLDTGATGVETTGTGNAVTAASYDPATRKLTLTKGATYVTIDEVNTAIDTKVGDLGEHATVKAYVDAKTVGIASEETVAQLQSRMATAEGDIDALETKVGTTSVSEQIDAKIEALNLENTYASKSIEDVANAKVGSVAAGDTSITVAGTATAPTVAVKVDPAADNAINVGEDGLKVVIPAAAEYSIVKDDNSGDFAAVYHLTKGGTNVGAAINIPKDMVVESGSVVENPTGQPAGTYIELVLQNVEDPLYINVGDLIEYVTSGSQTGDMVFITVSDDHKVTATITDGTITLAKLATDIQTEINKAHTHANKEELDKIATGDKAKWDAAEQNAKTYADGLNTAMDTRVDALEAGKDDYKAYADEAEADAIATASAALTEAVNGLEADIALKANVADVYAKTETYTKSEVDAAITGAALVWEDWDEA